MTVVRRYIWKDDVFDTGIRGESVRDYELTDGGRGLRVTTWTLFAELDPPRQTVDVARPRLGFFLHSRDRGRRGAGARGHGIAVAPARSRGVAATPSPRNRRVPRRRDSRRRGISTSRPRRRRDSRVSTEYPRPIRCVAATLVAAEYPRSARAAQVMVFEKTDAPLAGDDDDATKESSSSSSSSDDES